MKKIAQWPLICLFAVCFYSCMPGRPWQPQNGRFFADNEEEIFVFNSLAESISVIDPVKQVMYDDVVLTGAEPNHGICFNNSVYVVNSRDNSIHVIEEDRLLLTDQFYLGNNRNPWMLVRIPLTDYAYIPNFVSGTVSCLDLVSGTVRAEIEVGTAPEGAAWINDRLFVCNTAWDYETFGFKQGTVTVIDTVTDQVLRTITVATNPQAAVVFPSLNEVHIVCTGKNSSAGADDGSVCILDAQTGDLLTNIITGG